MQRILSIAARNAARNHVCSRSAFLSLNSKRFNSGGSDEAPPSSWPWILGFAGLVSFGIYKLGGPNEGEESVSILNYPSRAYNHLRRLVSVLEEPAFERLLPDRPPEPPNAPYPRPYTLVIDLDKFLVHHEWDSRANRWRIAKRPGAELFLFYAAQLYEVVVFSGMSQMEGAEIVKQLDKFGCISHSLFKFATKSMPGGVLAKPIDRLGRDMRKLMVLGHDADGFGVYSDNFIPMQPWLGDPDDRGLEESIDFLESVAFSRAADIRPIVQNIRKAAQSLEKPFPVAFDAKQAAIVDKTRDAQLESIKKRESSWLLRMLGSIMSTGGGKSTSIPSYWDKKEERIELRRKEYAHLRGLMMKQLMAEKEKEKAFYAEQKQSVWDMISGGGNNKETAAATS